MGGCAAAGLFWVRTWMELMSNNRGAVKDIRRLCRRGSDIVVDCTIVIEIARCAGQQPAIFELFNAQ
jgi:hypothetical protein